MAPRDLHEDIQADLSIIPDNPPQSCQPIKNESAADAISCQSESHHSSCITGWEGRVRSARSWLRDRWGWVITLSTFVIFLISYGFFACYGLLFVAFQEEFKSGATATGKHILASSYLFLPPPQFYPKIMTNVLKLDRI